MSLQTLPEDILWMINRELEKKGSEKTILLDDKRKGSSLPFVCKRFRKIFDIPVLDYHSMTDKHIFDVVMLCGKYRVQNLILRFVQDVDYYISGMAENISLVNPSCSVKQDIDGEMMECLFTNYVDERVKILHIDSPQRVAVRRSEFPNAEIQGDVVLVEV